MPLPSWLPVLWPFISCGVELQLHNQRVASDAFVLWDIYFGRPSVSESNSQDNYTRLPQGVSAWEEQLLPAWECHSVCGAGHLPGMRVPPSAPLKIDIVVHTHYPGPRAEAGESGISGHL